MLVRAADDGAGRLACRIAAVLDERTRGANSVDLEPLLGTLTPAQDRRARRLERLLGRGDAPRRSVPAAVLLARAYPDWIAQRRARRRSDLPAGVRCRNRHEGRRSAGPRPLAGGGGARGRGPAAAHLQGARPGHRRARAPLAGMHRHGQARRLGRRTAARGRRASPDGGAAGHRRATRARRPGRRSRHRPAEGRPPTRPRLPAVGRRVPGVAGARRAHGRARGRAGARLARRRRRRPDGVPGGLAAAVAERHRFDPRAPAAGPATGAGRPARLPAAAAPGRVAAHALRRPERLEDRAELPAARRPGALRPPPGDVRLRREPRRGARAGSVEGRAAVAGTPTGAGDDRPEELLDRAATPP